MTDDDAAQALNRLPELYARHERAFRALAESERQDAVTASDARQHLATLTRAAGLGARIPITRHGEVVAVLVSPADAALLERIDAADDAEDEAWLAELTEEEGEPVSMEEACQRLGLDYGVIRAAAEQASEQFRGILKAFEGVSR